MLTVLLSGTNRFSQTAITTCRHLSLPPHISPSCHRSLGYTCENRYKQAIAQYLIAGAFEDKVALFDEVKGELEVQIGALAQGFEVGTELAEGGVVHLAIERDVVLDLWAAVDAVQDVALQVLVYGVILLQAVQRDAVERQRVGDLLKSTGLVFSNRQLDKSALTALLTYNDSYTGQ